MIARFARFLLRMLPIFVFVSVLWNGSEQIRVRAQQVLQAGKVVQTMIYLSQVKSAVFGHWSRYKRLPQGRDGFRKFMKESFEVPTGEREPYEDFWNTPLWLKDGASGFTVGSSGPDKAASTPDDVTEEQHYPAAGTGIHTDPALTM